MNIPRNDFRLRERYLRDDPDAWYDEMRLEEELKDRPEPKVSGRFFGEPHRAIATTACQVCGAKKGMHCTGDDIEDPVYFVHFARDQADRAERGELLDV